MGKINLHCHSNYSDGINTLEELLLEHKKLGYDAFVITDHLYTNFKGFLTKEKYLKQKSELEVLSKKHNYLIIQGIELSLWYEEILVFGEEVIMKLLEFCDNLAQDKIGDTMKEMVEIAKEDKYKNILELLDIIISENKDRYAAILCHPRLPFTFDSSDSTTEEKYFYEKIFEIIDGYEHYNMGHNYFKHRDIPQQLKTKKSFKNSDAHSITYVHLGDNKTKSVITTEENLIKYIKHG